MLSRVPRLAPGERRLLTERLRAHVEMLAGVIGPRHLGKPGAMAATSAYIERQFAEIGDAVTLQNYRAAGVPTHNLIVERRGTKAAEEILIVGAHYDTEPDTPGADDNGSAVAMLLEVSRLTRGRALRRTVRFVAFTCEESPHMGNGTMGSQQYAKACRARRDDIVGMLCLEMVGYYSTKPRSQGVPPGIPRVLRAGFPSRGNFLAAVANGRSLKLLWNFRRGFKSGSRLPLFTIALPEKIQEIRRSDNSSFWDAGYPALMVTDTSFLRNPHYHASTDTPDTLDYERLTQATLGVAEAVARLGR